MHIGTETFKQMGAVWNLLPLLGFGPHLFAPFPKRGKLHNFHWREWYYSNNHSTKRNIQKGI